MSSIPIKRTLVTLFAAPMLALPLSAEPPVAMFPPEAINANTYYRDWHGEVLEELREKPLWANDKTTQGKQVIRFTFIPGATRVVGRHATMIRLDIADSEARVIARTQFNNRGTRIIRNVADERISPSEVQRLQRLADHADPWKFPVTTWENEDEITIHCTELIMERRQPSGYAVSHILIGCNHPDRLMPLVNYVAELAGQQRKQLRY